MCQTSERESISSSTPQSQARSAPLEVAQAPLRPASWLHTALVYKRPLVWLALAVIAGIKFSQSFAIPKWMLIFSLAGCLLTCLRLLKHGGTTWAGSFALAAAVVLGAYFSLVSTPIPSDMLCSIATSQAEPIAMQCIVQSAAIWKPNPNFRSQDPRSQEWRTQWDVECVSLRDGQTWKAVEAVSTLSVDGRIVDILPGDRLEVLGSIRRIASPTNPGAFDFAKHFQLESKFTSLGAKSRAQISVIERTGKRPLQRLRAMLIRRVDDLLHRWVAFAQAPLAAALVFGQREQVQWEDQQELMATGTLHLLAISGLHVEIVAATILLLATPFSLRNSTLLILIVCLCGTYAMLAGGKPPVLRAVIVVTSFALARALGRQARLSNILGFAALVLLLIRVSNVDNIGVQLSFVAVATIGIFALDQRRTADQRDALQQVVDESLSYWGRQRVVWLRSIRQMWWLSLWVWLLTCPLVWHHFHIIAPIAVPLNVLIALPLIVSLVSGLATGLLGWFPPLGWLAGIICGTGLSLIEWLVSACKRLPGGHVWLPSPPAWWIFCFYAIVALWLLMFRLKRNRQLMFVLVGWIVMGIVPFCFGPRGIFGSHLMDGQPSTSRLISSAKLPTELRCTFLNVGHGTSVILEMPDQRVWLYDAGHLGAADRSHQDIATALWQLPTARIDKLLISHADTDHYNATLALSERFSIGALASTRQFWDSSDEDVVKLLNSLGPRVKTEEFNAGIEGELSRVRFQVLHPNRNWFASTDNAASMCLLLEYAGKRILLPGDLEGGGLLDLTQLPPRPCHVLMAPHHGSTTIDPKELLAWCRPEWVIISGNHRATRQAVLDKYSSPGLQVGVTFRDGAMQVRIDQTGQLSVWHWQVSDWELLH